MHIGNYLGALQQWVVTQSPDAYYCVVDLHALTLQIDPQQLRNQTTELLATFLASGLDPDVCTVFLQSQVPYHAQLNWLLECVATYGELSRMTQFKEKAQRQEGYRVGLLTYPVLMAGDILLYEAREVPVGDDQRQHLEITRVIAERFNNRFGETFTVPVAVQPKVAARVMDLQEPTRKMSKSVSSHLQRLRRNLNARSPTPTTRSASTGKRSPASLICSKSTRALVASHLRQSLLAIPRTVN
jgi:tryptophanyl-tRNA synthetase